MKTLLPLILCYKPGGTGSCGSLSPVSSDDTESNALHSAMSSSATALAQASTLLDITEIDPTDTDITD